MKLARTLRTVFLSMLLGLSVLLGVGTLAPASAVPVAAASDTTCSGGDIHNSGASTVTIKVSRYADGHGEFDYVQPGRDSDIRVGSIWIPAGYTLTLGGFVVYLKRSYGRWQNKPSAFTSSCVTAFMR